MVKKPNITSNFMSNLYSNYSKIYVAIIINQTHNDQNGANLGACFDIALYALLMYSVLCYLIVL